MLSQTPEVNPDKIVVERIIGREPEQGTCDLHTTDFPILRQTIETSEGEVVKSFLAKTQVCAGGRGVIIGALDGLPQQRGLCDYLQWRNIVFGGVVRNVVYQR
jgi:hypothetical protein